MNQCLCISSQWNRLCSTLPGWELKYFLVPLLARKENKSNKFSNNLERFLLLEEFPTDWNLVFNCLCNCVRAHVCVCVRVKHLIVPAVFVFGGDTIPTVYTLGTEEFSSLSLCWLCFWVDQQHNPRGVCFPEHGAVACLLLHVLCFYRL